MTTENIANTEDTTFREADTEHIGEYQEPREAGALPTEHEQGANPSPTLPLLPLSNIVIFPGMIMSLVISGEAWTRLIDDAALADKRLTIFWRSEPTETFDPATLGRIGTLAAISQMLRLADGNIQVMLQGLQRVEIEQIVRTDPYPVAQVRAVEDLPIADPLRVEGLRRRVLEIFEGVVQKSQTLPDELSTAAANAPTAGILSDLIAANLVLSPEQQQSVRDLLNVEERLMRVLSFVEREREILEIGQKAQEEMSKGQREYVLRQQLEAIKRELGETDDHGAEIAELYRQLEEANLPDEPRKEAERELKRLSRLPPGAAEYNVARTYLDWLLELPWNKSTPDQFDLDQASEVLDTDHYNLEKIKERILEYLAVRKLQKEQGEDRLRGPILCFVGPPGVGKTSLGQSIARALGREFMRVALGGVRDESEIRGFRRTYIGALPGRIIQGINRAGTNNPVLMLDEVDKLSSGLQGDPAAALLELLDPEQNRNFVDRYLDIAFDLSRVLFICTANRSDTIPPPLLDRMEMLELTGYTEREKVEISKRYLVPRQRSEQGLSEKGPAIGEQTLSTVIHNYTREAGVRNLERQIGALYRKMATRLARGQEIPEEISPDMLEDLLGVPRFRKESLLEKDEVGVVTGLAWTPVGGDVLFVEVSAVPGSGNLTLTGHLGDVMRESARAAMTYARSRADALGLPADFSRSHDVHVHVPAGAVPKDGPSAGITIASGLVSAITKRPANKHVAMTGEISLHGRVLPIGGIKEKLLAAQRMGVHTVLLPQENAPDVREIPAEARENLEIILVSHMDEVLPRVLHPDGENQSSPE
jgi:ATP-dependent Lon protease